MKKLSMLACVLALGVIVSAQTDVAIPHTVYPHLSGRNFSTLTACDMDQAGDSCAFYFQAPKAGDLEKVGVYFDAVSNAQTIRVSFQDREADPGKWWDDTQDQFNDITPAAQSWVESTAITSDGTGGGTRRTVTQGEFVWLVMEWESTAGDVHVDVASGFGPYQHTSQAANFPRMGRITDGSTKVDAVADIARIALWYNGDDDPTPIPGQGWPCNNVSSNLVFASDDDPDEVALKFQLKFDAEVSGALFVGEDDGGYGMSLYTDAGSLLASHAGDQDVKAANTTLDRTSTAMWDGAAVQLTAYTDYRVSVIPLTTTNIELRYCTFASVSVMNAIPEGPLFYWSERADAGTWTDNTTRRPFLSLVIEEITFALWDAFGFQRHATAD